MTKSTVEPLIFRKGFMVTFGEAFSLQKISLLQNCHYALGSTALLKFFSIQIVITKTKNII